MTGATVYLKFENLQFTAAYKERGALNTLLQLDEAARAKGVIAASAGNHAQGVAYHAHRLGIPSTIVMRSEEHTSELQSLMRNSYAVFCLKTKNIACSHTTFPQERSDDRSQT